ncbi:MAG: hypothetical protein JO303_17860 [Caulobacteraceae bacterium]|nr:hypothetical protein [Caulobacteraceae bacterium]
MPQVDGERERQARRDTYNMLRLIAAYGWIVVAIFGIWRISAVLIEGQHEAEARFTWERRLDDLRAGAAVAAAGNGNVHSIDGTTASSTMLPNIPDSVAVPAVAIILSHLSQLPPGSHFSEGELMNWLEPLSVAGKTAAELLPLKKEIVEDILKKTVDVAGDLISDAGKAVIERMLGEHEAETTQTEPQTQTQICMLPGSQTLQTIETNRGGGQSSTTATGGAHTTKRHHRGRACCCAGK